MTSGDWAPSVGADALRTRASLLSRIRSFFADRGVLEVETPLLSRTTVTDPAIESFRLDARALPWSETENAFLQTSPEYHMKRLLGAGAGDIYQIARAFRAGESGRNHNPEFTLLEWYRLGFDHWSLMDEVAELVDSVLPVRRAWSRFSYVSLFQQQVGLDPLTAGINDLSAMAADRGIAHQGVLSRNGWIDLLFTHLVEPFLKTAGAVFIYDYPAEQAALAKLSSVDPRVAHRFELFVDGLELANGYHELLDADEQRSRFARDNEHRRQADQTAINEDERLLSALETGIPQCAGVALGLDRLLMCLLKKEHLDDVLAFPASRA